MNLSEEQKQQYLQRSYTAVDGLWFMMAEEAYEFEKALELDRNVWSIMPKIQARFLKEAMGINQGLSALEQCFTEKLRLDGIDCTVEAAPNGFTVSITKCPWHETMLRSGREDLSPVIGKTICTTEYAGWAKEFGDDISVEIPNRICAGEQSCRICFWKKKPSS